MQMDPTRDQVPVSNDAEHDELRETASLNFSNAIEVPTTFVDKQTSIVTTSTKRAKPTNLGSTLKPYKKSKIGVACEDPLNGVQCDEVSTPTVNQTFSKAENISSEKKKLGEREKGVELKRPMTTSPRKTRLSANSRSLKALPQAAGHSTIKTTPNIVKKKHVTKDFPIPVVVGLQCYTVRVSQRKNSNQPTSESPENLVEHEARQSVVPLVPKATGYQEGKEADSDPITKRKKGTSQRQPKNHKSSLADLQDSSKQKENEYSEVNVEKSLDTASDDQPLSSWFLGKHSLVTPESTGKKPSENSSSLTATTTGDGQTLTFQKRSSLWETIESLEAFRVIPQKPHFRPLDNIKESARERHAIKKMVDFSAVFEETRRLQIDHPRNEIEDQLAALLELETHGFVISFLRNRLMDLFSLQEKQEQLESRSKEVKDNLGVHRVEAQKLDKEIESIDKQVSDLLEKRDRVSKEKEKRDSEIAGLEAENDAIEEGALARQDHSFCAL